LPAKKEDIIANVYAMGIDCLGNVEVNYAMSGKNKIVGIGLLALLSFAPILFASSGLAICSEDRCNGGDPIENGCNADAYSFDRNVGSYKEWGRERELVVELRYSPKCQAVWARAGRLNTESTIWVETADKKQYNNYTPSRNGTYYTSMQQKLQGTKACAKVGNNQQLCTNGMP
jgi:Zn-finger nucleic acid-binding protein